MAILNRNYIFNPFAVKTDLKREIGFSVEGGAHWPGFVKRRRRAMFIQDLGGIELWRPRVISALQKSRGADALMVMADHRHSPRQHPRTFEQWTQSSKKEQMLASKGTVECVHSGLLHHITLEVGTRKGLFLCDSLRVQNYSLRLQPPEPQWEDVEAMLLVGELSLERRFDFVNQLAATYVCDCGRKGLKMKAWTDSKKARAPRRKAKTGSGPHSWREHYLWNPL